MSQTLIARTLSCMALAACKIRGWSRPSLCYLIRAARAGEAASLPMLMPGCGMPFFYSGSRFDKQAKILFASDGSHAANLAFVLTVQ